MKISAAFRTCLSVVALLSLLLLSLHSCREDDHPEISFLPSAQVLFVDSVVEIDLNKVDLEILTMLKATVSSPVGLAKVQIAQVNRVTNTLIDTLVIQEISSFSDSYRWSISENVKLAGYTKGINIRAIDKQGQMSQRMLPVVFENTKTPPSIAWTNPNGSVNTTWTAEGITVKKYNTAAVPPVLGLKFESRNGNEPSWGLNDVATYLVYTDGRQEKVEEASRNFTDNPCIGCRDLYAIPAFTPAYAEDVKQIRVVAVDIKSQKTESYINVKVYETHSLPEIVFAKSLLTVDGNDESQAVVEFDVMSEDVAFNRFVYYLVRTDGTADSIGVKTSSFSAPRPNPTARDFVSFQLPATDNVSAFRVKVVNAEGGVSQKDLPIKVAQGAEGVKHLRDLSIFTYNERSTRSYVYSVKSNRMYMDGEAGAASVGVDDPDIVFHCTNDAYIYMLSPTSNGSSNWKGSKTRKTVFVKLLPKYGVDFETATRAQIMMFDSILDRSGELTVSAANRPKRSLIGLVKSTVVDDRGRIAAITESTTIVDQPAYMWSYVRITYDNTMAAAAQAGYDYSSVATRSEAALDISYAFKTHDGTVGLIKITEGLMLRPGILASNPLFQSQRVTFSLKIAQ